MNNSSFENQSKAQFRCQTFHEPNLIRIKAGLQIIKTGWINLDVDLNCSWNKAQMAKNAHFRQTAYKIRYNNLCISFGTWKVWCQSESKLFQSCSKGKIPGRTRWKEWLSRSKLKQVFLIDSDAKLFMYLIQCIRFSSGKVRCLNWA